MCPRISVCLSVLTCIYLCDADPSWCSVGATDVMSPHHDIDLELPLPQVNREQEQEDSDSDNGKDTGAAADGCGTSGIAKKWTVLYTLPSCYCVSSSSPPVATAAAEARSGGSKCCCTQGRPWSFVPK